MFIIIEKEKKIVVNYDNTIEYQTNEYPVIKKDGGLGVAYPTQMYDVAETESIPEDFAIGKYIFENSQFTLNPDWVEPDPSNTFNVPDDVYMAIKEQAIQEVQNELNK